MKKWMSSGTPWIWLNAGAVSLSLVMVVGLLMLITVRGLGHFWPSQVVEAWYQPPGSERVRLLGEVVNSETVTPAVLADAGMSVPEGASLVTRLLFKHGNRDLTGRDFHWYVEPFMSARANPADVIVIERMEWGNFYGYLRALHAGSNVVADNADSARGLLKDWVQRAQDLRQRIRTIERRDIGRVNDRMEALRLEQRRHELAGTLSASALQSLAQRQAALDQEYEQYEQQRQALRDELRQDVLVAETMDGRLIKIPLANIVNTYMPNAMGLFAKLMLYGHNLVEFVTGSPREANTEGGVFPAIFGTVMMVLLMSIIVTPMGVLAAIYLREYAKQGLFVRMIRISVNNLAGVPSIVFGVFGLGFFVYWMGGSIDRLFFPESLPSPTFGTPGLLWASLTLALLTLPVVIVATEEGLTRIPRAVREGSLALGATKAETLWRVVVPMAAPAMMTGLILAVARAAGEVAPLMLVGVVKLAPNLPLDAEFPFLHLDRKFMHLGFHIFDVGFQSPNVEAARPLVYATALMLVVLIVILNLTAIAIRNHLREKYKSGSD
ncbi:MAG: phosphate ABC transporter permease PstA [Chromatiales bacterium]|jgi:phosphate transport system permease protein|nr:phosphate ABC transporter permease PstA [Chromatiales bacterium]